MKLEITKNVSQTETIDVEFPFYYKNDMLLDDIDYIIYGKIEPMLHTKIHVIKNYRDKRFDFQLEHEKPNFAQLGCYFVDGDYASNEAEYLAAKTALIAEANEA